MFKRGAIVTTNPLESYIERNSVKYAEKKGWLYFKVTSPTKRALPDRFFARKGEIVFVEFKRFGEKARKQQEKRIKELRDHGVTVHIIDTVEQAYEIFR